MGNTAAIISELGIDTRIQKLINGEVKLPSYFDDFNSLSDYWYPHPPCLVPTFLGYGASYKGVINHFFCERENSYVEYFLEHGYITESARTFDQFITKIVLLMIMVKEGLTPEIIEFCKALDYHHYEAVEQFALDYGDDPQEFGNLVSFDKKRPIEYLKDLGAYDGNYPSSLYTLHVPSAVYHSSIFEIAVPENLSEIDNLPPWLMDSKDRKSQFYQYLANHELMEAWFTLNTKGWLLKDVADALGKLKDKANSELLSLVADNWISGWQRSSFPIGNL